MERSVHRVAGVGRPLVAPARKYVQTGSVGEPWRSSRRSSTPAPPLLAMPPTHGDNRPGDRRRQEFLHLAVSFFGWFPWLRSFAQSRRSRRSGGPSNVGCSFDRGASPDARAANIFDSTAAKEKRTQRPPVPERDPAAAELGVLVPGIRRRGHPDRGRGVSWPRPATTVGRRARSAGSPRRPRRGPQQRVVGQHADVECGASGLRLAAHPSSSRSQPTCGEADPLAGEDHPLRQGDVGHGGDQRAERRARPCRRCGRRRGRRPRRGRAPRRRPMWRPNASAPATGPSIDINEWAQPRCPSAHAGPSGSIGKCPSRPEPGVGAGHQPVVHDEGTADARADRQHGEVLDRTTVAEPVLGLHQGGEVVGERRPGTARREVQLGAEVDVAPSEERRPADIAEVAHDAAEAHADGSDRSPVRQRVDERGKQSRRRHPGHGSRAGRPAASGCRRGDPSAHHERCRPSASHRRSAAARRRCRAVAAADRRRRSSRPAARRSVRPRPAAGDPAEAGGRQVEPLGELGARERAVEQDLQHDAPGGRCERTPRLDPRRHGRRA